MLEVIVHPGPQTEKVESPIPVPNDDQVVIKVVVSGSNPKDWKVPERLNRHVNEGDDIAGIVHQVGKNVTEFKVNSVLPLICYSGNCLFSTNEAVAWRSSRSLSSDGRARGKLCRVCGCVGAYDVPYTREDVFRRSVDWLSCLIHPVFH